MTRLFIAVLLIFPNLVGAQTSFWATKNMIAQSVIGQTYFWWDDDIYSVGDSHGFGEDTYTNKVHHTRIVEVTPWIDSASAAVNTWGATAGNLVKSTSGNWKEVISDTEWVDWPASEIQSITPEIINATDVTIINATTSILNATEITSVTYYVNNIEITETYQTTNLIEILKYIYNYLGYDTRLGVPFASTADGTLDSASRFVPLPEGIKNEDANLYYRLDESKRDGIPSVIPPDYYILNATSGQIDFYKGFPFEFSDPFPPFEDFTVRLYADYNPLN